MTTQAAALTARGRRLLHDHRTRARRDGQQLDYGLPEVLDLLAASSCCAYCKMPCGWDVVSLDHRIPTGRGGKHALENLSVCCRRCNGIKGQQTETEFRELLAFPASRHPVARGDLEQRLLGGGSTYAKGRPAARPVPMSVADGVAMAKTEIEILKAKLEPRRRSSE
jgi:hypothetical protein